MINKKLFKMIGVLIIALALVFVIFPSVSDFCINWMFAFKWHLFNNNKIVMKKNNTEIDLPIRWWKIDVNAPENGIRLVCVPPFGMDFFACVDIGPGEITEKKLNIFLENLKKDGTELDFNKNDSTIIGNKEAFGVIYDIKYPLQNNYRGYEIWTIPEERIVITVKEIPKRYRNIVFDLFENISFNTKSELRTEWQTYTDEKEGFLIQFPNDWKRLDMSQFPSEYTLAISPKEDKFSYIHVLVGSFYIKKKPEDISTLEDWAELEIQGEAYKSNSFKRQFVKTFNSNYETGVYFRVTQDIQSKKDDFIQDKYMFMDFLNNKNNKRTWFIIAQFSQSMTSERVKKEIKKIAESFDVLNYK